MTRLERIGLALVAISGPASAAPLSLADEGAWMPDYSGMNMVFAEDDAAEIVDRKAPPALPPLDLAPPVVPPEVCIGAPTGHPGVCWVAGPFAGITPPATVVPLPAALPLLVAGILSLVARRRRT